ncbi:SGNH/GDSL hydrolase family protein [Nocardia acidivorans]|uniref:SGNH/GDSL hydrolase family protein n=1 Tax=Nocardia acidivorans TaxID=404580 RepID=UPI000A02A74D|nr:SGNH/GDSL hydrolase family protein [Nocardia acidivorans]
MFGRSGIWACAVALVVAATISGSGVAGADPAPAGKELVVLGDSFTANKWDFLSEEVKCVHGETSWPAQLVQLMRTDDYMDASCPGASIDTPPGYTLAMEAQKADKAGAFGPNTKLVTLQIGLNDRWGATDMIMWWSLQKCIFDLIDGCGPEAAEQGRMTDYRGVSGAMFAQRISNVVTYIKYYAPNARIVLVGYPELFPSGQDSVCISLFGIAPFIQPRGRAAIEYLDRIDRAQREAASLLGIDFLDTRTPTLGHGLCSADPWLNGVLDYRTDIGGLPFHPSAHGDAVVANAAYERYGR